MFQDDTRTNHRLQAKISMILVYSFCFNFLRTSIIFVGALFWIYSDVCPRLQSQGGSPRLHTSSNTPLMWHLLTYIGCQHGSRPFDPFTCSSIGGNRTRATVGVMLYLWVQFWTWLDPEPGRDPSAVVVKRLAHRDLSARPRLQPRSWGLRWVVLFLDVLGSVSVAHVIDAVFVELDQVSHLGTDTVGSDWPLLDFWSTIR